MMYLVFFGALFLALFPVYDFNIGFLPLNFVVNALAVLYIFTNMRRPFNLEGIKRFTFFAVALVASQYNAPEIGNTFLVVTVTALYLFSVPYLGVLVDEYIDYKIFTGVVAALNIYLVYYAYAYSSQIYEKVSFGPLSLNSSSYGVLIMLTCSIMFSLLYSKQIAYMVKVGIVILVTYNLYVTLFLVGNRSGFLSILIGFVIFNMLKSRKDFARKAFISSIFIAIAIFLNTYTQTLIEQEVLPSYIQRKLERTYNTEQDGSTALRVAFLRKSVQMFLDYPVIGGGYLNFIYYSYGTTARVVDKFGFERDVGSDVHRPHNLYSGLLGETGLFGSLSFLALMFWVFGRIRQNYVFKEEQVPFIDITWAWIPAWLTNSFFHDGLTSLIVYMFALFYSGLIKVKRQKLLVKDGDS